MIHTYSLIHDDLPAMDNDDYRRGRLTNHKVYGEAAAFLAGDGLLNLAFETMGEAMCHMAGQVDGSHRLQNMAKANAFMARCAGPSGMIAGQIADLASEGRQIDIEELTYIEYNKTSQLLMAALVCGGLLAGADDAIIIIGIHHIPGIVASRTMYEQIEIRWLTMDSVEESTEIGLLPASLFALSSFS